MKIYIIFVLLFFSATFNSTCNAYSDKEKALACVAIISDSITKLQSKITALKDDMYSLGEISGDKLSDAQVTKVNEIYNTLKKTLFSPTAAGSIKDYDKIINDDAMIKKGLELAAKK
ncbi:MAG: hypothetical protein US49_C0009G0025 [candidate division TM6 bacterium GW2011_GWF2_37_49]|nr:MAG: hypothetical protein US49_C0009G0025 [candidate division TM6 bacterium GW2011_GWF2_37_49]